MAFENLTLKQVGELIPDREAGWLKANRLFYMGDHLQDFAMWSGAMVSDQHELYHEMRQGIQNGFVSKNAIAEGTNRHMVAVIGHEPAWTLTVRRPLGEREKPNRGETTRIAEGEALLTSWWDGQQGVVSSENELTGAHKVLQSAVLTVLLSKRGPLRLFVPPGELDKNGQVRRDKLEQSIKKIFVHHPEPVQATVIVEKAQMSRLGCYIYQENKKQKGELSYLDQGRTIVRIISEGDELPVSDGILNLNGRLTMYEMRRPLLITEQVRQLQRAINVTLTMLQRNIVTAGALERTFMNAQLPGREVPDPKNPGQTIFKPDRFHVGGGITNFMSGLIVEDAEGNAHLADPKLVYRDPVSVEVFEMTRNILYRSLLEEIQQIHALISGDATASGESRVQARVDFLDSLLLTKPEVDRAIRWLLETVLAMAAAFSGQPGRFDDLRVNASARLKMGPISADERRVIGEMVDKGLMSQETAMTLIGIEDTDAEKARIRQEQQDKSQSLATALLNAQRGVDSGAASRGLEQPTNEGTQIQ